MTAIIHATATIHATAIVEPGAAIGAGTKIWHFCHVMPGARIGAGCVLGQNVFVGGAAIVGDGCKIQNNVSIYDAVELEADVFVGPSVVFTNVKNPRAFISRKDEFRATRVARGASIGANATIVCEKTLGSFCFVAAGAVVTRDVPAYALVVGVPARRSGWVCRCGLLLPALAAFGPDRLRCGGCGSTFRVGAIAGSGEGILLADDADQRSPAPPDPRAND